MFWRSVHTWRATSGPIGFALHAFVIRGCSGRNMLVSAADLAGTDLMCKQPDACAPNLQWLLVRLC